MGTRVVHQGRTPAIDGLLRGSISASISSAVAMAPFDRYDAGSVHFGRPRPPSSSGLLLGRVDAREPIVGLALLGAADRPAGVLNLTDWDVE
jgi:hypothetical protein